MKANELRIGNYIQTINGYEQVVDVMCDCINTKTVERHHYGELFPIPLTEEWLVKFGFEKNIGKDLLFLAMPKIKAEIHYEKHNYGNLITLQSDFGMFIPDDILYVHQLQNLYFTLTGTELTTNN